MRGSRIYTMGRFAPETPACKKIYTPRNEYLTLPKCVKFQLSSFNSFGDMLGSEIYIRGAAPLTRPLAEKFSHPKRVFDTINFLFYFMNREPNHAYLNPSFSSLLFLRPSFCHSFILNSKLTG